jgi:hypothetical protein
MAFLRMNKRSSIYNLLLFGLFILLVQTSFSQDSLLFKGQLSGWINLNSDVDLPVYAGLRYIPTLNYQVKQKHDMLIDFEVSANINGAGGFHPFDTGYAYGKIKPYRIWARYSSRQFEIRLGLQKINFGSATMLRPLMWFDQLDPRDPLQLTDGVWGLLGRYYFLNNASIWIWGLYGNEGPKTWETGKTSQEFPELGGRFQFPVPKGEVALSYHFREADTRELGNGIPAHTQVAENRVGIDGKWDLEIGLWFEGSWINKNRNTGIFTNQEVLNLGADYTLGLGNGLNVVVEQLLVSYDEKTFEFANTLSFTGTSWSYPLGMFDNISAIFYYDWTNDNLYNFVNWKRQFNKFSFYLMAYWNPKNYKMPQQDNSGELFSGKGIQIMLVYNH